jgi:hypothetical protein
LEERQRLYLQLAERTWNIERLTDILVESGDIS